MAKLTDWEKILRNAKVQFDAHFPAKTLEYMIQKAKDIPHLLEKLIEIKSLPNDDKKNRWFGYYQAIGEVSGVWKLDEIIVKVREEFEYIKSYGQ